MPLRSARLVVCPGSLCCKSGLRNRATCRARRQPRVLERNPNAADAFVYRGARNTKYSAGLARSVISEQACQSTIVAAEDGESTRNIQSTLNREAWVFGP